MLWKIKEKAPEEFLLKFPEIHPVIANLLYQRKIIDHKKVEQFLCPDYYKDPYDPFLMLGMKKAIDRIIAAIFPPNRKADDKKEKIVIFGDYDADGVCASALLSQTLILLGADVSVYIPNREAEGYGMNAKAIEEFSRQNVNLVITVDCGISNKKEVDLAKKEGIDVIITDHHPIVQDVPDAFAVVDPKQKNDKYPFKFLAGVGVAYKLISALLKTLEMFSASLPLREGELEGVPPQEDKFSIPNKEEIKEKFQQFGGIDGYLKCMLDIVALGTVADVCPLIDENRTLVKYGLMILEKNWRLGIAELLKAAQIYDGKSELSLDTHSLGYQLGPRLNASGRIDHANTSYQLLITRSRLEAQELAKDIEAKNTKRQKLTKQIIDEIKKDENIAENNFIFASLPDCIAGIVGLIAGKITDEFGKPAFIISEKNELAKGSCRAPECFAEKGFHLGELLADCKDVLIEFGGHAQAAGFSLEKKNIPALKNKIKEIFKEKWDDKVSGFSVCVEIDQELEPDDVDWDLLKEIEKMAPFGEGNRQPLFILKKVFVKEARVVGNGSKHLKLTLRLDCKNGKISYIDGIGFGLGNLEIKAGDKIDAVFYLEENTWNGNKALQLKLKDITPAK